MGELKANVGGSWVPMMGYDDNAVTRLDALEAADVALNNYLIGLGEAAFYVPTLLGSTTNPNIGSTGSRTGWYSYIGDFVFYQWVIIFGGTGITQGSGVLGVTLPVAPKSISGSGAINRGGCTVIDSDTANRRAFFVAIGSEVNLYTPNFAAFGAWTSLATTGLGITWATGDQINGQVLYHGA